MRGVYFNTEEHGGFTEVHGGVALSVAEGNWLEGCGVRLLIW